MDIDNITVIKQPFSVILQISTSAPRDRMTAFQALLPAQTLLDHTSVLVNLDMRETERQAVHCLQARNLKFRHSLVILSVHQENRIAHSFGVF